MEITSSSGSALYIANDQATSRQSSQPEAAPALPEEDSVTISPEASALANTSFTDDGSNESVYPAPDYP